MSKINLTPNASGTGVFTIASPNSNTDRTLNLPDEAGEFVLSASGVISNFTSTGIDDNATSTAITIDASQNIGIGTTSPAGILNVDTAIAGDSGASSATRTLFLGQTSGSQATSGKLLIQGIINPSIYRVNIDSSRGSGAAAPLSFSTANGATETMRIDASGNVTIGSTDAGNAGTLNLSVGLAGTTAGGIQLWSPTNGSHFVQFGDSTGGDGPYRGVVGYNHTNDALIMYTAGTESARIDSSGNLLVGTTSADVITNKAEGVRLENVGNANLYSGTLTTLNLGRANAGVMMQFWINGANASGGISTTQGGTPTFFASSDERLKDNITDHESELANVMALRPTRWDWKKTEQGSGEGFIAQELEQTAWSDLVSEGDDGFKIVAGLGTVETRLIKAIQEQQAMIEDLESRLSAVEAN
jgi:hypothetical protein